MPIFSALAGVPESAGVLLSGDSAHVVRFQGLDANKSVAGKCTNTPCLRQPVSKTTTAAEAEAEQQQ